MGRAAFLDLKEKGLSLLIFDGGSGGSLRESLSVPCGDGYSFETGRNFQDISVSCLSLPLQLLNFRIISLPFSDMKKIREVIPLEMGSLILSGADGVVFDARIIGAENGRSRVLVAYIQKDLLRSLLRHCKSAGFDPKTVTCLELAGILSAQRETPSPELFLDPPSISANRRRELAAAEMQSPCLNFRRDEFAYTADDIRTTKSLRTTAALTILIIVLLLSFGSMKAFSLNRENRAIRDDMRKTYSALFPEDKKVVNELLQMKSHIKEMREKERYFAGVAPLQVLMDLSKVQKPGVFYSEITIDREFTLLKGECPSLSDVQAVKKDLEGFFAEVNISDTKPSSQNRTAFTITVRGKRL